MPDFGFGQPHGGIVQTTFVVGDIGAAITLWTGNMKAGPFFPIRHRGGDQPARRRQDGADPRRRL